jgi:hypothetical protein
MPGEESENKFLDEDGIIHLVQRLYNKMLDLLSDKITTITTETPEYLIIDNTDPLNPEINLSEEAIGKLDELLSS